MIQGKKIKKNIDKEWEKCHLNYQFSNLVEKITNFSINKKKNTQFLLTSHFNHKLSLTISFYSYCTNSRPKMALKVGKFFLEK